VKDFVLHSSADYIHQAKKCTSSDLVLLVPIRHASKVSPKRHWVKHASDILNLVKHPQLKNNKMLYMAVQGLVKVKIQSLDGDQFCCSCSAEVHS